MGVSQEVAELEPSCGASGSCQDALADLAKKIMQEVRQMIQEQEVRDAIAMAKGQLSGFLNALAGLPLTLLVDQQLPEADRNAYYLLSLDQYKTLMESAEQNIFGSFADCLQDQVVPLKAVDKPGKACAGFWAAGAIFLQNQYVMVYMNLLAQMAVYANNADLQKTLRETLQSKAATYHALLNASYHGFLKQIDPPNASNCHYTGWPSCSQVPSLDDAMWDGENVACVTGCSTDYFLKDVTWCPKQNPCTHPATATDKYNTQKTWPICSMMDFTIAYHIKVNETIAAYSPTLGGLKKLSEGSYNSSAMVNWITNDPPAPIKSELNSTGFCTSMCMDIVKALSNKCIISDVAQIFKTVCHSMCPAVAKDLRFELVTRCLCQTSLCPALRLRVHDTLAADPSITEGCIHVADQAIAEDEGNFNNITTCNWACQQYFPMSGVYSGW